MLRTVSKHAFYSSKLIKLIQDSSQPFKNASKLFNYARILNGLCSVLYAQTQTNSIIKPSRLQIKEIRRYYCEEPVVDSNENCEVKIENVAPMLWTTEKKPLDLLSEYVNNPALSSGLDIERLLKTANEHLKNTLIHSFKLDFSPNALNRSIENQERILVVYDSNSLLSRILTQSYNDVLAKFHTLFVNYESTNVPELISTIATMKERDLVILVQTNAFRLNDYRLRIELFKVGIKNLEHTHLYMMPPSQIETYINSMSFHPTDQTKSLAHRLKHLMDNESKFVIESKGGVTCVYDCRLEPTLLNIGDYEGMKGIGGTFPVGEVFSEAKSLEKVNGSMMVFAFPDSTFDVQILEQPFKINIEKGQIISYQNAPKSFVELFDNVQSVEAEEGGGVLIREFGVGLNTAIGKSNPLQNVTAFERQAGFHISVGRKHTVYKKVGISAKKTRWHIDLFVDLESIKMGNEVVFKDGKFIL